MKKLCQGTILLILGTKLSLAGVPCTLPFQLQNNQLADATQVMANYNAIIACLGNAAAAGINNDITSLQALTTPIAPALGGTQTFTGGTSTGSANAQVVNPTVPAAFALSTNYKIIFTAGFTNTGPMTLVVGASAATNVFRRTTDGVQALAGGEIIAGSIVEAVYDGTRYQLISNVSPFPVGTVLDTVSASADPGFLLLDGSCKTQSTFPALFAKMGSFVGSCSAGQFQLPDGRGRTTVMLDMGAGNLTTSGSGCAAATTGNLYNTCGSQNHTMTLAELVAHSHTINDPGHTHTITPSGVFSTSFSGALNLTSGPFSTGTLTTSTSPTGITGTTNTGGGSPFATLQPTLLVNKQVKY